MFIHAIIVACNNCRSKTSNVVLTRQYQIIKTEMKTKQTKNGFFDSLDLLDITYNGHSDFQHALIGGQQMYELARTRLLVDVDVETNEEMFSYDFLFHSN